MIYNSSANSGACIDHTTLYKSCVKTLRAKNKAQGAVIPNTRIFPSSNRSNSNGSQEAIASAQYFQKAREIQDNITKYRQLLNDHRKRYLGQIRDPSSMSAEDCVYVDKIIANNLQTVEQLIIGLEDKVPAAVVQKFRKAAVSDVRVGDDLLGCTASLVTEDKNAASSSQNYMDIHGCMAITVAIVRASLQDLNITFASLKETKEHKQTLKVKLTRLHRPAGVEKNSTAALRQRHLRETEKEKKLEDPITRNCRKKVQFEDWRDDEDTFIGLDKKSNCSLSSNSICDEVASSNSSMTNENVASNGRRSLSRETSPITTSTSRSEQTKVASFDNSRSNGEECFNKLHSNGNAASRDVVMSTSAAETVEQHSEPTEETLGLSSAECQLLEQENTQLYNELQSTHEEVRQITRQVVELGRLQDALLESVEEQSVVADSVHHLVLSATDNVHEGNEQIREAMRKDASFRVWILFFLIVMSFTILFLDWYND